MRVVGNLIDLFEVGKRDRMGKIEPNCVESVELGFFQYPES